MENTQEPRRGPGRPSQAELAARADINGLKNEAGSTQDLQSSDKSGSDIPSKRVRRPFGSQTQKLFYPQREGYHRHWFNDVPGRIDMALEAGYEHVREDGKSVIRYVGVSPTGGALNAFLMETPKEWHEDDLKREQRRVDLNEAALKKGSVLDTQGENQEVFYNTAQGRKTRFENR